MHLAQATLTAESLHEALQAFAREPHRLEEMARRAKALGKPQAARDIADLITAELAGKEESRV